MRVVLDTNVVVSAILFGGLPRRILEYQQAERCYLLTSEVLFEELRRVFSYSKFGRKLIRIRRTADELVSYYKGFVEVVDVSDIEVPDVARDPADNHVLACALAGQAFLIVSGDSDLLSLGEYEGVHILSVADFIALMEAEE